ncbi:attachment invasion locus protein [Yersinia enterocolitica]|nr:attachment invasion locus protein [Yersinia enterocolitica]
MKKTLLTCSLVACLSMASVNVYAEGESSVSLGYAQSHVNVKEDGDTLDKDPKGFNLKYRYEHTNNWGMISSFTYTHQGYDLYDGSTKFGNGDFDFGQ